MTLLLCYNKTTVTNRKDETMNRRSRNSKPDGCLLTVACAIGIPTFLIMTNPFIFWLIFVPLIIIGAIKLITWLKK